MSHYGKEVMQERDEHYKRLIASAKKIREEEDKASAEKAELEYLRYFFLEVDEYLGPAGDDCYFCISEEYKHSTGKEIPEGY